MFCSLLYVQACRQLGDLMEAAGRPADAKTLARRGREAAARRSAARFGTRKSGFSTPPRVHCKQPDIWGSAFAVYLDVATPEQARPSPGISRTTTARSSRRARSAICPAACIGSRAAGRTLTRTAVIGPRRPAGSSIRWTLSIRTGRADGDRHGQRFPPRGVSEWVLGPQLAVMNYLASATMPLAGVERMMARRGTPLKPEHWSRGRGRPACPAQEVVVLCRGNAPEPSLIPLQRPLPWRTAASTPAGPGLSNCVVGQKRPSAARSHSRKSFPCLGLRRWDYFLSPVSRVQVSVVLA